MADPAHATRVETMARGLARTEVRLVLSTAIIVSLLPFEGVHRFDLLFLLLFGVEFSVRAAFLFQASRGRTSDDGQVLDEVGGPRTAQWILLSLDFLALVSFVPVTVSGGEAARWLRLFRLTRMLLLVSYWAPILADVWSILARRERLRQVAVMGILVAVLSFGGAVILDHLSAGKGVDFDGNGAVNGDDRHFVVQLWWAFRQVQDPGNMLAAPAGTAAVFVSLALTIAGLFMVSFLIGLGTDVVRELMALSQLRPPGLRGHTVVVNINVSTRQLLSELMRYRRKLLPPGNFSLRWVGELWRNARQKLIGPRYVVVGPDQEAPDFLRQPELANIVYRHHDAEQDVLLDRADVNAAQRVVLLADLDAQDPDAETIHALLTIAGHLRQRVLPGGRARLLIAEILDESNIPAAQAAISSDGEGVRAFVVPTERLIALFVACVARRPGIGALLEELLTSRGHEVYTCYFSMSGLGYRCSHEPALSESPREAMSRLVDVSRRLPARRRVVPVGLLAEREGGGTQVWINPREESKDAPYCGFVAVGSSFYDVRDLAEELGEADERSAADNGAGCPELAFVRDEIPAVRRILVCGFRSATVSLVEALLIAEPGAQVLVIVEDETERAAAWDAFDAHTNLLRRGLMHGPHCTFDPEVDHEVLTSVRFFGAQEEVGTVFLEIGDWTSSRRLAALPRGFGSVESVDLVLLVSGEEHGSDPRTLKTLMKLENLSQASGIQPRVVAEVLDADLAQRLRHHYTQLGTENVEIYSIQALRSYFMFQSVVVPSFDMLYAELMGPWGQSLLRKTVKEHRAGECSFEQLSRMLAERGEILVAVEQRDAAGQRVLGVAEGGEGSDQIDLDRLEAIWVVSGDPTGADM